MDCAEHKNNDMAHCPQCLAMYWKAKYESVKAIGNNCAPQATGWQPIETAPDGLHLRAAWVYNVPNNDWIIEVHSGYVDDDGMFVNQYGDTYGIAPNEYFGWQPLPPAPGGDA